MMDLMIAGGIVPMSFVLLFGGLTFAAAVRFAQRPRTESIGMVRGLSIATVFTTLSAMAGALGAVFTKVPSTPAWAESPDLPLIVMTGLGEALSAPVLGFSLLSLAWLVAAVGVRRLGALEPGTA